MIGIVIALGLQASLAVELETPVLSVATVRW